MIDVKARRPNGETVRIRRVSPVQTKRGATRYEMEVRSAIVRGELVDKDAPKPEPAPGLADWAETYTRLRSKKLRPSTIGEQRRAFRLYLVPLLGASTPVDSIRTPHFELVSDELGAAGLAPKTINNTLAVLSGAIRYFYKRQDLPVPHFDTCRVKVPESPPKFWEPEQLTALVDAAADLGAEFLAVVLLMADCGLRTGEVLALEWGHLSWGSDPAIVIQRALSRGHFGAPKSGKPRTVPMTKRTADALRALPPALGSPWVMTRHGASGPTHYTRSALTWLVALVERSAGLVPRTTKDGQLHRLRHSYITRLAAAGVPAREIMALAGHAHLATSQRYMHLINGAAARAVASLERFDQEWPGREDNQGQHRGTG